MNDPNADRGEDDNGELLCSVPSQTAHSPASCLASALVEITRAASAAYKHPQFMRLPDYELQEITD